MQSDQRPDPVAVMAATGVQAFQLAFVLAPAGGGCAPTWDGNLPLPDDGTVSALIGRIRGAGGDVSVSFGGAGGRKLGEACGTPAATAGAFQQVINRYRLKAIDIDIETGEFENGDRTGARNELGAARLLQRDNPGLFVSITVPGYRGLGLGYWGTTLLGEAKDLGFTPDNWSIMPFDAHFAGAGDQIAALDATKDLLRSTFGWTDAVAYAHLGFSGMNGRTDPLGDGSVEYFRQADFQAVLDHALAHGMGRFTNWSVNRDRECVPVDPGTTSSLCSSVAQAAWDFTRYSARFAGAAAPGGLDPYAVTYAVNRTAQSGTQNEPSTEGGQNVAYIARGDWLGYAGERFATGGSPRLSVRYAAGGTTGGWIELRLDSLSNAPAGRLRVDNTGGWQSWRSGDLDVGRITGTHDVYLTFASDAAADFVNVHRFQFAH